MNRINVHTPTQCQGMQENGSIQQRQFRRTMHEKPNQATRPACTLPPTRVSLRPCISLSPSLIRMCSVFSQGKLQVKFCRPDGPR